MLQVNLFQQAEFLPEFDRNSLLAPLQTAHAFLRKGKSRVSDLTEWVSWPEHYDRAEYARLCAAAEKIRCDSKILVVIGIGGSYLGAKSAIDFLCPPHTGGDSCSVCFAGTGLCSDALREILRLVRDVDFSVNVISKSGTTAETSVAFRIFRALLEEKYGKEGARARIYATTDPRKGALRVLADREGWEAFSIPAGIGGRYSVLTAAGLLPIAAAGIDTDALLAGAAEMQSVCKEASFSSPAWQYAALRHALYRAGHSVELLVCYDPSLRALTEWWKQLFGESEGKSGRGLFPAAAEFTADLHSMGQYLQQGPRIMLETILMPFSSRDSLTVPAAEDGLCRFDGQTLDALQHSAFGATLLAHSQGGVPCILLNGLSRTPFSLGELFYFFEYACALSAQLLGVSPFDQPGVEAYKRNMAALSGKSGLEAQRSALEDQLRSVIPPPHS